MQGAPQLTHRAFDLRALEWYRNDPRFEFETDDIHGKIFRSHQAEAIDQSIVRDRLKLLTFGFAYDDDMRRAIAVFLRYLHELPTELQIEMERFEITGGYKLHPDFFRTQILGEFPEKLSVYDAFLQERFHINRVCELIGKAKLFCTDLPEFGRPRGFGILLRPTRKELREFALKLDQLLSDDLNRKFFLGDLEVERRLTDEEGNEFSQPKGTIQLLEEWIARYFKPSDPTPIQEMFKDIRAVRAARQKPAHKLEEDSFDQKYVAEQRALIVKAYNSVHTLRMILENHPSARDYQVPDHLRNAAVWTH